MTTMYYEWGVRKSSLSPGGSPTVVPTTVSLAGTSESFIGSLAAGNTTITFTSATKQLTIRNRDDVDTLEFSLDAGGNWHDLGPYAALPLYVSETSILLRPLGAAVGVDYEIIAVLAE